MTQSLYSSLGWLPEPPADFSAQCRRAASESDDCGRRFQRLACHALDENQLNLLAKAIEQARERGHALTPLIPFRLGIMSSATAYHIAPALLATGARHGFALECIEAGFGQLMQEALAADSTLNRAKADAVLLAIDHRGLPLRTSMGDSDAARQTVAAALDHLGAIRAGIHAHSKATCIVQTVPRSPEAIFGSLDLAVPGTVRTLVDSINRGIVESVASSKDLLFDVAGLADTVGLENWHDPTLWNLAKLPFATNYLPIYCEHVCRLISALRGKSRRCLVLDLDNTLWQGVIGDDGLEGIVVGQGDATGEGHLEVQKIALTLRDRGVVLAASSKNDDGVARLPFQRHPEMLLREDHFAVFQANWSDKATNIKAIAEELSLSLESLVFLDDSPAERAIVRQMLPQVCVPELPSDPSLFARTLLASGYFESIGFSNEDRKRAEFYHDNARRITLRQQIGDIDEYLASLDMTLTIQPFDESGRGRITQLINKSNQFNLTTRRYTEAEIAELERDSKCLTMQIRLADTFGDNGMICVVICRQSGRQWDIDTWLMSCRVLGRKVENAVAQELVAMAARQGVERIVGIYRPTERNRLVEDHYKNLGFTLVHREDDGATTWELDVASAPKTVLPMEIQRLGFDVEAPT